jgi:acyl-CoA thioester hydrolase
MRADLMDFIALEDRVGASWIDINGHMDVEWYDRVFDRAETRLLAELGIDDDYIRRTEHSIFRVERTIRYQRELLLGAEVTVRSRILWADGKRIHHAHALWNEGSGTVAAECDVVSLHVDLRRRRSVRIADAAVRASLESMAAAHSADGPSA